MRCAVVLLFVIAAVSAKPFGNQWENFKGKFAKVYENAEEEAHRIKIFTENLGKIAVHNARAAFGLETYTLGVNEFADWTFEEFTQWRKGLAGKPTTAGDSTHVKSNGNLPASVDWRTKNAVTPIKNQGQCGSCWSFSTTGSIEGQLGLKGKLTSLSEQQLVDCSTSYGNQGCNGGLMDQGFAYAKAVGLESESDYPYTAADGTCNVDKSKIVTKVQSFVDVASGDESALQDAVANVGPVSVAMDASHWSFQLYRSGVYSSIFCSSTSLDHGVLAVGYGTDSGKDYWIVKNSWGTTWGEQGFFRLLRNSNNECGIATQASYPVL